MVPGHNPHFNITCIRGVKRFTNVANKKCFKKIQVHVCGQFIVVFKNILYFCVMWSTKVHN